MSLIVLENMRKAAGVRPAKTPQRQTGEGLRVVINRPVKEGGVKNG